VTVSVDQAMVMKLPERVATIVIGNTLIADASLQAGGIFVVTGKGYGATNLPALDRAGRVVIDETMQVLGAAGSDLVTVFKDVERESYSCALDCQRRLMLGDSPAYFTSILSQDASGSGQAQTSAPAR
jgi:Flp pilus assembly secretin CpaC